MIYLFNHIFFHRNETRMRILCITSRVLNGRTTSGTETEVNIHIKGRRKLLECPAAQNICVLHAMVN